MKKFFIFLVSLLAAGAVIGLVFAKNNPNPERKLGKKLKKSDTAQGDSDVA